MPKYTGEKDCNRVAGGLKATVHNPNTSEEAKESARERLQNMGVDPKSDERPIEKCTRCSNHGNVMGGYKAMLANSNVSEEAKEHAREVLEENGEL